MRKLILKVEMNLCMESLKLFCFRCFRHTCLNLNNINIMVLCFAAQPYWSQGAKKQYYISKRCASKKTCERTRRGYMGTCTHIWYQDWKCAECCAGDRCNYYVIVSRPLHLKNAAGIAYIPYKT